MLIEDKQNFCLQIAFQEFIYISIFVYMNV